MMVLFWETFLGYFSCVLGLGYFAIIGSVDTKFGIVQKAPKGIIMITHLGNTKLTFWDRKFVGDRRFDSEAVVMKFRFYTISAKY